MDTYSVSRLKCFSECRRKAYWRYEANIEPCYMYDVPLRLGSLVHDCLELYHGGDTINIASMIDMQTEAAKGGDEDTSLIKAHATAMMHGYMIHHPTESWEVIELEGEILQRLPGTMAMIGGRVDGLVRVDGEVRLLEHKTAAAVDKQYVEKLWTDLQIQAYCWAQRRAGHDVSAVIYNVLRKPSIRRSAKKAESWDAYTNRCRKWCETTPDAYTRLDLYFSDHQIESVVDDLVAMVRDWDAARRDARWPRNRDACFKWGRACPFFKLCSSGDDPRVLRDQYRERTPH
jgi:hypothetical protein